MTTSIVRSRAADHGHHRPSLTGTRSRTAPSSQEDGIIAAIGDLRTTCKRKHPDVAGRSATAMRSCCRASSTAITTSA